MYKLKELPEDFIVNEINNIPCSDAGEYSYFILKKKDYPTPVAVEKIAHFIRTSAKNIGYAGTKDRRAITTQWISIKGSETKLQSFSDANISLEFKGKGNTEIYLGRLEGNAFEIVVRNIAEKPKRVAQFLNLFDEQRFSTNNVVIGRALVKKDFKKAIEILMESDGQYEKIAKEHYEQTHDAINSMRKIPMHIFKFYVHAYQSEIWNKTAELLSNDFSENIEVPIVGFGTDIDDEKIKKAVDIVLKEEGITARDFIIKSFPELSSEGSARKLYTEVKNLQINELEVDELNTGMKKCKVSFSLDKGCYATMAIQNMFK